MTMSAVTVHRGSASARDLALAPGNGPGPVAFFALIKAWREGGMEGLEMR